MPKPAPYAALYELNWLSASGTACLLAILATALVLRVRPGAGRQDLRRHVQAAEVRDPDDRLDARPRLPDELLGHDVDARPGAGRRPAARSRSSAPCVGWLGVFLTGSDTSANALFGNLQVVTANALGLNPILTASVNSAAGVMGKMISVQSIAVAVAATGMTTADESRLFRFTIKHSILLMMAMGDHFDAVRLRLPGGGSDVVKSVSRLTTRRSASAKYPVPSVGRPSAGSEPADATRIDRDHGYPVSPSYDRRRFLGRVVNAIQAAIAARSASLLGGAILSPVLRSAARRTGCPRRVSTELPDDRPTPVTLRVAPQGRLQPGRRSAHGVPGQDRRSPT